ncbi:P-loop containing nucleoside triphosphate hydrolase protein [Lentinula aff. detonsa]|uniref:P-loop containing nucleoside triphosphate hydrolase protein n=1 Tax=Lentinula aff. detonsa TaxID=2804958 RepID=A0AA38KWU3_9AGAR|nr:P-loop containing nucleoside triphosphate hydrolase protein [Lentinula aff. detonsa]
MGSANTGSSVCSTDEKPKRSPRTRIETLQLGVYRVMIEKRISSIFAFDFTKTMESWRGGIRVLTKLVEDIVRIAPALLLIVALVKVWESHEEVVLLSLENRILRIIENGLSSKNGIAARALIMTVLSRIIFVVCSSLMNHWSRDVQSRVRTKVLHHYDDFLLIARLRMDLPTLQDNRSDDHLSARIPWDTFTVLLELSAKLFAVASQLGFMFQTVRSGNHGIIFAALCVAKPLIENFARQHMWSMPRVVEATNTDYLRMRSLKSLESNEYRLDILSGNLIQYIITEFRNARKRLGEISTDYPETQYYNKSSPTTGLIASFVGDFPLMYYVAISLLKPSSMSLATIASLQQSAILLRWLFWDVFYQADSLRRDISRIQHLYDLEKANPIIKDGDVQYPPENHSDKGMALELNHVLFSYPGSKEDKKALDGVSFRIEPGELIVIVGANGSGKSTFVKLLTRLYDVNSGTIIVDGQDIRRYKLSDLRKSIATLSQDHLLFPLSVEENIGLGYPEAMTDMGLVNKAVEMGGAQEILKKLNNGLKTVLDPLSIQYGSSVQEGDGTELAAALKQLQKKVEVSGGERQRIVAARTFMRFNSNQIKFVAVDEPSSALDPEGELQLFNNLRQKRAGKTMIFVTHRFGHLTKHADKILCMKDGKVAEYGSHAELLTRKGEYYKMYNIQAQAFENVPSEP